MKKLITISLFICVAFIAVSAKANLLVDPGFEANPLDTAGNVLTSVITLGIYIPRTVKVWCQI